MAAALGAGAPLRPAFAQADAPASSGSGPVSGVDEGATREVEITVEQFGAGGTVRRGDWAAIRLALRDRGDRVRGAIVRLHITDPDGDTAFYTRSIVLNPGRTQGVWVYPHLPFSFDDQSLLTVTVHAAAGDEADEATRDVGQQIGAARIAPSRVIDEGAGLIAIVGRARLGLDQYSTRHPRAASQPGTAHELTEVAGDVTPASMPDRWFGLAPFESVIWSEGDPAELSDASAEALREWVWRGGHLVVVLPPVGQAWTNPRNPLIDLMPSAQIERREGVDLEPYRIMLTRSEGLPLPTQAVLHTFTIDDGTPAAEATSILSGPDRASVAVRRLVGTGMVTVVGFDLASSRLAGRIDAQSLWHRLLGKRADVLAVSEMMELERPNQARTPDFTNRTRVWVDDDIAGAINMTGEAGVGVLLALVVFTAYLLLAGPLGFAILRRRGLKQHAWVAFLGTAALFTLVAWGGASALRPTDVAVQHLSMIDHVFGQPVNRARTWFGVILPTYGAQRVSIGDPEAPGDWRHTLTAWHNPAPETHKPFPDSRGYIVQTSRPDTLTVPTRSTVKQFQADWIGAPPWKMPSPVDGPIRLDDNGRLRGRIAHELPGLLEKVQIVLVQRQAPFAPHAYGGRMPFRTRAWSLAAGGWAPGEVVDLSTLSNEARTLGDQFFRDVTESGARFSNLGLGGPVTDGRFADQKLAMLTWAPMLEPPVWQTFQSTAPKLMIQRRMTHGWDVGKWFTQPCLIVVGQLPDAASPVPIYVDGERAASRGRTVVRWIYPLTPSPVSPAPGDTEE